MQKKHLKEKAPENLLSSVLSVFISSLEQLGIRNKYTGSCEICAESKVGQLLNSYFELAIVFYCSLNYSQSQIYNTFPSELRLLILGYVVNLT